MDWRLALAMIVSGLVLGVLLRLGIEYLADIDLGPGEDWWL